MKVDCDNPPVRPVPVGTGHVNIVPEGSIFPEKASTGVKSKATPLQVVAVNCADMIAFGRSDTVTVNA